MKCQGTLELLCILSVVATVASQSVPPGRVGVSYAKFHNKFYVYGGRNKGSNQTFTDLYALDLSKPWSSQSPAWIPITKDGPTNSALSAAISVDGKTFMLGPTLGVPGWLYSFETKVWSEVKAQFRKSIYDTYPVTLGTDDRVLMAGGSSTAPITPYVDDYDLYTMGTNQTVTQKMPLSISNGELFMPCRIGYKGVWSDYLNKAVLYGGYTVNLVNDPRAAVTLSLYDPVKNLWSEMKTTGRDPNVTMDHCMAITDDGKKIITFGGYFLQGTAVLSPVIAPDLYILDLTTETWTKGKAPGPGRTGTSCTTAGDYFLLYGGENINVTLGSDKPSAPVDIYHITDNMWVTDYKPSAQYMSPFPPKKPTPSSASPPSGPGGSTGGSNGDANHATGEPNIIAIVGGVVGGVVVMALIGFLVWRRKRSQQSDKESPKKNSRRPWSSSRRKISPNQRSQDPQYGVRYMEDNEDYGMGGFQHSTKNLINMEPMAVPLPSKSVAPHYPAQGTNYVKYVAEELKDRDNATRAMIFRRIEKISSAQPTPPRNPETFNLGEEAHLASPPPPPPLPTTTLTTTTTLIPLTQPVPFVDIPPPPALVQARTPRNPQSLDPRPNDLNPDRPSIGGWTKNPQSFDPRPKNLGPDQPSIGGWTKDPRGPQWEPY